MYVRPRKIVLSSVLSCEILCRDLIHECIKGTLRSIKDARASSNQQIPAPRDALSRSVRFSMKTPEETTTHQYDSDENERNMSPEPVKQCRMITLFFELIIVSNKGWHKGIFAATCLLIT